MTTDWTVDGAHDVVAIGGGPFNLGLTALASRVEGLDLVTYEANTELRWHPGLMFPDARLQLSFLADLVTLVDPTHPLSFLAYVQSCDRMYPFFIREEFRPTRREYEAYLRWAASHLPAMHWGHRVDEVQWDGERDRFVVRVSRADGTCVRVLAKDLVVGIGTEPTVPSAFASLPAHRLMHSAAYLNRTPDIAAADHVTVIGSGQSAAEIVLDLLQRNIEGGPAVTWLTRAASFAPLDASPLVLEMTTPAYVRYFHALPQARKDTLNREQWQYYKGISVETLERIHDLLYERELAAGLAPVELRYGSAVEAASVDDDRVTLTCRHRDTGVCFEHATSLVVAATGYTERQPHFLALVEPWIRRDERGRYRVGLNNAIELDASIRGRIFVVNAELHSHGAATPDLGVSAYRNATILNAITGREIYKVPGRTAFTTFPPPASTRGEAARGIGRARIAREHERSLVET